MTDTSREAVTQIADVLGDPVRRNAWVMGEWFEEADATIREMLNLFEAEKAAHAAAIRALAPLDEVVAILGIADDESISPAEAVAQIIAERDAARADAARLRTMLKAALSALEGAAKDVDACAHLNDDYFQESICTRIRAALAQEPPA